ncbi:hypothetical protein K4L44_04805 [Halosquirtibacter laminarini]|uniref:Uncharacterized protein n=1 Tax=Halosquirtibacter laminarini TaxID=3374600 RepID=A0AC61NP96_9BACT|nr:hypothetical protein K4L44_04805 [Prolixibacteraceae bacterium]
MDRKHIVIFGQSGMIGNLVTQKLIQDASFNITSIQRKQDPLLPSYIQQYTIDCIQQICLKADHVVICIGARLEKREPISNLKKVDLLLVNKIAKWAQTMHIPHISIISSIGADRFSTSYYLKMKGQMERSIRKLSFDSITFYKPALFSPSQRVKKRWREWLPYPFLFICKYIPLMQNYQPVCPIAFSNRIISNLKQVQRGIIEIKGNELT